MKKLISLFLVLSLLSCSEQRHYSESYVRQRVVQLTGNDYECSGVQVEGSSGASYILTAAHCEVMKDSNNIVYASLDDHRSIPRKVLEISDKTDLMLIEGMPNLKGVELGETPLSHEYLYSLTHGNGKPTYRKDGEYLKNEKATVPQYEIKNDEDEKACLKQEKNKIGEISIFLFRIKMCMLSIDFSVSTLASIPGSSGGAILNQDGKLVSIVSASSAIFTYSVPTNQIKEFLSSY